MLNLVVVRKELGKLPGEIRVTGQPLVPVGGLAGLRGLEVGDDGRIEALFAVFNPVGGCRYGSRRIVKDFAKPAHAAPQQSAHGKLGAAQPLGDFFDG